MVHFGKDHNEKIECTLCDFIAKDQGDLDNHLSTCENYKCDPCSFVTTTLASMKRHKEKNHQVKIISHINHNKQKKTIKDKFDSQYYTKEKLFSMSN